MPSDRRQDVRSRDRGKRGGRWFPGGSVGDLLWVAAIVGGVALALFLISGTWPAVVTVESGSMLPNMHVGDLVFLISVDRCGPVVTWVEGRETGYRSFGDFGDVIVYRPNGADGVDPIIHRAIVRVNASEMAPYFPDPHGGILTRGDNNRLFDQGSWYGGIGPIEPVLDEWIVGKAVFAVPLLGYLPLHPVEFGLAILLVFILLEVRDRRRRWG
ncbi:MAG: S24/S26 family peptidase [Methanoculleaceae archaeon]